MKLKTLNRTLAVGAVTILLFCAAETGCRRSQWAQFTALGSPQRITLYGATGEPIRSWKSTGKVSTEEHTDGWFFEDAKTKTLVRVTGSVVIEAVTEE